MNHKVNGKFNLVSYTEDPEKANCLDFSDGDNLSGHLIIGSSPEMKRVYELVEDFSKVDEDYPVLITGETGTGKELVARAIGKFYRHKKTGGKFVAFNSAAYPESLIDSELFGHEKGAYTGATKGRVGIIEAADGGILFMDELGNAPSYVQEKLLRAVENKEIIPLGFEWKREPKKVNVRIIASTNTDIDTAISSGKLTQDLIYRLKTCFLQIPPLRYRREDIRLLADYFLEGHNRKFNTNFQFDPKALHFLEEEYEWPGNVRELENVIKGIATTTKSSTIDEEKVRISLERERIEKNPNVYLDLNGNRGLKDRVNRFEAQIIYEALKQNHWYMSKVAEKLGISRATLLRRIKKYGITDKYPLIG